MPNLQDQLEVDRCPHCGAAKPVLSSLQHFLSSDHAGGHQRTWRVYQCTTCGGLVTAAAPGGKGNKVTEMYPEPQSASEDLPSDAREYLNQAMSSLQAPAGAIMLAASSVDAMLKAKGYADGSLHQRIREASSAHVITDEMALWADEVRLDANAQRHADSGKSLPSEEDARHTVDFASALGDFMFALPARIKRGRGEAEPEK